ncbi:hypothetical protein GCM10020221_14430 [Streptomyces thioluteus]|uniref:Uncharacterized protein n=1 Tax=Streptomyces thioluteus TaxID=66431 RepID=A0ABN3WM14_STRTU
MNSGMNSGTNHPFPDDSGPGEPFGRPDFDEEAVRRLMRGAVGGLEPSDGALDHLRRAVPVRRTRRRQALGGAVAAAVLLGVGLPAVLHVADEIGSTGPGDRPANAASSRHHSEGTVEDRQPGDGDDPPGDRSRDGSAARGDHRGEPSGDGSRARGSEAPQSPGRTGTTARPERGPPSARWRRSARGHSSAWLRHRRRRRCGGRVYGAFPHRQRLPRRLRGDRPRRARSPSPVSAPPGTRGSPSSTHLRRPGGRPARSPARAREWWCCGRARRTR